MEKSKVFFTRCLKAESLVKMYEATEKKLNGNIAIKVHSGEEGNQNFLHPEYFLNIIDKVKGTVVECNTAYEGERSTTEKHIKLFEKHGWTRYYKVDLLDAEGPDAVLDIKGGKTITKNYVGKNLLNYDSMLVLSHFKGHPMGGFGGALKQLSIGCASAFGKRNIHGAGDTSDSFWDAKQDDFIESMAEAASSIVELFKGNIVYISVMCNMSVDCDCCAVAEDPCMKDIGILASLDPIAIDKACLDLVYAADDDGKAHFIERVESRNGAHIFERAVELGFGSTDYELINLD